MTIYSEYQTLLSEYQTLLETLPPECEELHSDEYDDLMPSCTAGNRCREYYDTLVCDMQWDRVEMEDESGVNILHWLIQHPEHIEESISELVNLYLESK